MQAKTEKIVWAAFEYYPSLKKLWEYANANPNNTLTLLRAAGIAGMEPTYFSKFFRKKVGVGFKYWCDFHRVERSKRIFDASDISVTFACLDAGFNDMSTFERTFKRITGMTPSEYRNVRRGIMVA